MASSQSVQEGFTKDLSLGCNFTHSQLSQFSLIMSLIMEKTDDVGNSNFAEIATVSALSSDRVDVKNSLGANVTGDFDTTGDSQIMYTWQNPTNDVIGRYKCIANGMDKLGHPVSSESDSVVIREQEIDLASVISKMREMEIAQNNQKHELEQQKIEIADLKEKLNTSTCNQCNVNNLGNISKTIMTADKMEFRGHEYIISTTVTHNVPVADVLCRIFGGYLVEIEDAAELKAVGNLVRRSGLENVNVIGGTDEGSEGTWRFQYSQKAMTFFQWHTYFSGRLGTGNNCLSLSRSQLKMFDNPCVDNNLARFICEIPL